MDRYSVESTTLTGIADAIREKTGGSEEIKVEDMASSISEISGSGMEWCNVTVKLKGGADIAFYGSGTRTLPGGTGTVTEYELGLHGVSRLSEYPYDWDITVPKYSILVLTGSLTSYTISGELEQAGINMTSLTPVLNYSEIIVVVKGDGSITYK